MSLALRKLLPKVYGLYFNGLCYVFPSRAARRAFDTFCKVRKGRVLPKQEAFLQNAMHTRENVQDHVLQTYHWEGKREPVLLIHGWESNSFRWHNLITHLRDSGFEIYAFDAPGHGYSTGNRLHVPLYTECVHHMVKKYKPRHIVGHSMGGMAILYTLYRFPDQCVEKIVTIGAPSEFKGFMTHFRDLLKLNDRMMTTLDAYLKRRFGFHVDEFSSARFAGNLPQRGLLFHDIRDTVAPFHASEQVHSRWSDSILVATEGLGHSMHQDEVNQQISDFLIT